MCRPGEKLISCTGNGQRGQALPVFELHQVQNVRAATDEEDLHDCVVQRNPAAQKEVDISSTEHGEVKSLCFVGDTWKPTMRLCLFREKEN